MQNSSSRIGFFTIFGPPWINLFYHFWSKNRLRSIGGRRAPSPNALFSTLWRPISAQRHFLSFLHFFQLFSSFCMNGFFLKTLRFALVKHTFVKTFLMNSSVYAFFGRRQTTKILLLAKVKLTFPKKSSFFFLILLFYAFSELSLLPRQGSEFWKTKKKVNFPIGKWTFLARSPPEGPWGAKWPPKGAIWPSKLSSFWSKILRCYRKSIF